MLLFIVVKDDIQKQLFPDRTTPVLDPPTQVFSYEYIKNFKNSFFYRTPPVAVSVHGMACVFPSVLIFLDHKY